MKGIHITSACALFIILVCFASPWIAPYDPYETNANAVLMAPEAAHWFGTDSHGRDILSRVLVASRMSVFSALGLTAGAFCIGTIIGTVSGYYGGRLDALLMRVTDVFLAFPEMIPAVAVAGMLGGGLGNAMLAVLLTTWTQYARLARSSAMSIKEETYIQAARISGCSDRHIMWFHVLPNSIGPLLITATLHISVMMMSIAGLSFLGLGVKVPEAEWGAMISDGRNFLQTAPWVALTPGAVMVAVMAVFNLLGDQVRDRYIGRTK